MRKLTRINLNLLSTKLEVLDEHEERAVVVGCTPYYNCSGSDMSLGYYDPMAGGYYDFMSSMGGSDYYVY